MLLVPRLLHLLQKSVHVTQNGKTKSSKDELQVDGKSAGVDGEGKGQLTGVLGYWPCDPPPPTPRKKSGPHFKWHFALACKGSSSVIKTVKELLDQTEVRLATTTVHFFGGGWGGKHHHTKTREQNVLKSNNQKHGHGSFWERLKCRTQENRWSNRTPLPTEVVQTWMDT